MRTHGPDLDDWLSVLIGVTIVAILITVVGIAKQVTDRNEAARYDTAIVIRKSPSRPSYIDAFTGNTGTGWEVVLHGGDGTDPSAKQFTVPVTKDQYDELSVGDSVRNPYRKNRTKPAAD